MSNTIDEQIVEMKFDNKQFERNVSATMSTIDKLKQKLTFKGVEDGFNRIGQSAKNVDMSPLGKAAEQVAIKFDAMQVAAFTALTRITNKAIDTGERLVKSLSTDQITAGWSKYEQKTSSVQTLVNSTGKSVEEINSYLNKLMWYSDETSYGFNDMVSALATMVSSGGDMDKLIPMIEGVANATAFAGKGAAEFSRIMQYSVNQAYSLGYMQVQDWKSIEGATVNSKQLQEALIAAGESLGKFKKGEVTLANFRSSLADKWLDKDVMEAGFGQFAVVTEEIYKGVQDGTFENYADGLEKIGNKYGEVANRAAASSQEAKSFTEAIDATKDAVSSGWMKSFELIFGNYEQAKILWTDLANALYDVFAAGGEIRNEILKSALGKTFIDVFNNVQNGVKPLKESVDSVKEVITAVKDYAGVVDEIISGKWGNGQKRWDKLTESGYDWAHAQNLVNERLECGVRHATDYKEVQEEISDVQVDVAKSQEKLSESDLKHIANLATMNETMLTALGYSKDQIDAFKNLAAAADKVGIPVEELVNNIDEIDGRYLLINSFKNIGNTLLNVAKVAKKAWGDIFPSKSIEERANGIFNIITAFHKYTRKISEVLYQNGKLTENGEKLVRTLKGVFAIIDVIRTILGGGFRIALKVASSILGYFNLNILDVTAAVGDALVAFRDWINSMFDVSGILKSIGPKIEQFKNWFASLANLPGVQNLVSSLKKLKEHIAFFDWSKMSGVLNALMTTLDKIVSKIKELTGIDVYGFLESVLTTITTIVKNITGIDLSDAGENIFDGLKKGLSNGAIGVIDLIAQTAASIISKFCEILGIHSPSKVFIDLGMYIIQGLIIGVKKIITKLPDMLTSIAESCIKTAKTIDWGAVLAVGSLVATLLTVKRVAETLDKFAAPFVSLSGIFNQLSALVATFGKVTTAMATNIKTKSIKNLAISLAILTACVVAIVKIGGEDYLQMWNAVGIIAALAGILLGLSLAMRKLSDASISYEKGKGLNIEGIKSSLLSIAAAIGILALTVKLISGIKLTGAIQGFAGLVVIMGSIIAFIWALNKVMKNADFKNIDRFGLMLIELSAALLIMAKVCKAIGNLSLPDMGKGALFVVALGGFIIALTAVAKTAKGDINKVGGMAIKLALAMGLMVIVCKMVRKLSPAAMIKGAVFALLFVGFVKLLAMATSIDNGRKTAKLGGLLLGVSASMALMAGVCKLVSKLSPDEMKKGAAFALGFVVLTGILVSVTTIAKDQKIAKVGKTILAISIAVAMLAGVAALLSLVSVDGLVKGIAAVTALGLLTAVMIRSLKGAQNVAKSLTVMTTAIVLMAVAVVALSIIDPKRLVISTAALVATLGAFALVMSGLQKLNNANKVGGKLTALLIAVGILSGIVVLLSHVDSKSALANVGALSLLVVSFTGAILILSLAKNSIDKAQTAMKPMLGVVVALGGIIGLMSMFPLKNVLANATALSMVLLTFSASMVILGAAGRISTTVERNLSSMLLVVAGLGAILSVMSMLPLDNVLINASALSLILLAFSASMVILGAAGRISTTVERNIAPMLLVVVGLGTMLSLMSVLPLDNVLVNATALSMVLLAFSAAMVILGAAGKISTTVEKVLPVMGVIVLGLGAILAVMSVLPLNNTLENALALSTLLLAFSASIAILGAANRVSVTAKKALLPMLGVLAGVALILGVLSALKLDLSLETALSLSTVLLALSAAVFVLSYVGPGIILAGKSLAAMGILIAGLAVILVALGGLSQIDGFNDLIRDGGETLALIGYALGNFVGSLVGGFAAGVSSGLPEIGENLSKFMENVAGFIEGAKTVDDQVLAGVAVLSGAVIALTAADFINGVAKFLSGGNISFPRLGDELSSFMEKVKPFITGAKLMDPISMKSVKMLVETLLLITGAELLKGITSFITGGGTSAMEQFEADGVAFFKAIKAIAPEMTGFTFPEDFSIEGLKTFLGAMNTVAASMAGVAICDKFAQIAGDEGSMEKFETDGKAFFKAIKAIAPEMTGFTFPEEFSVEGLKTLLTSLNEVALSMAGVSLSDLFSKLAGDAGTMEKFEADGKAFFGAIKAISTEAAGFKLPEGFSTQSFIDFIGCLVAISFTSVGTSLVDAFNKFIGKKGTIEKFQTDGVNLMRAIKAISDETEGLSTDGLTVADTALTKIKKLIEDVNGIDYSGVSAFTGVVVGGFGAAISFNGPVHNLGLAMKDYSNQVKDIDIDAVKVSVDAAIKLKNLISDLVELNTNGVESFKTAVESLANVQIGNITATFSSAIDGLRGIGENFETAMASGMKSKEKVLMGAATMQVQNLMDTFTKGIEQKRNSVVGAMTSSLPDAVSSIRNYYGSFASAGRYLADGFANGIGENAYKAAKEVQSMALQAKKAMEETLKIHSPSRVFYQEGDYTGMGFVNALHDYGSKAYDASASMANYARDGLNNAIKQIGMDLNGDLDSQPTIRPVLDLTDVQNGAARIGGLFGSGVSIDTMANLQSINTMMSDRNQNGTNADVISAINKLGSSLSNGRGGDSYVINGMTYDDGSNIASAMKEIVREARLERRR